MLLRSQIAIVRTADASLRPAPRTYKANVNHMQIIASRSLARLNFADDSRTQHALSSKARMSLEPMTANIQEVQQDKRERSDAMVTAAVALRIVTEERNMRHVNALSDTRNVAELLYVARLGLTESATYSYGDYFSNAGGPSEVAYC